ncbi:murein biosynthesis integral membrane protein MurJ, partial [Candidatus Aminicenantes bacterium AC-335-G13]|nr:murein biosynthesis integral membrane protein MurJ [Candidatus Aminicenantes bacterium AC-335-G13]
MSSEQKYKRLLKSTVSVSLPTIFSRVLGFFRDILLGYFMGTGTGADAFTIAFVIPNLLRRLTAEGALTAAFIPVFTEIKVNEKKKRVIDFANAVFYNLGLVVLIIAILGIIFAPYLVKVIAIGYKEIPGKWELTINLTRIMFPYIFLISLAALCSAILNSYFKFFIPASTPILFNIAIILSAWFFTSKFTEPAYAFAIGVIIGGFFQFFVQIPFLLNLGFNFKPRITFKDEAVRKVGKLMVPGIFGFGIFQINLALSRALASLLEEGSVSALYYATRVRELTLGLFSIALSIALLPTLSEQAAQRKMPEMKKTLIFSLKLIVLITLPSLTGLLLLSKPIIQVLFERGAFVEHSTNLTSTALVFFSIGLPFISGSKILNTVYYSLKDTKTPVIIAAITMVFYLSLSFILMKPLKVGGIALALSLAEAVGLFLLWIFLERKIGGIPKRELFIFSFKVITCSILMGIFIWIASKEISFSELIFIK